MPALLLALLAAILPDARVTFLVTAPPETPPHARLFIAGNHHALGPWSPDALPLTRNGDGSWSASCTLPDGYPLEFKVTQGSWETVEKGRAGEEIPNRTATVRDGLVIRAHVESWASLAQAPPSTLSGTTRHYEGFPSRILDNRRDIIVYLPPGYDDDPAHRFPVLYMHDARNVFNQATAFAGQEWGADEAAEQLIRLRQIQPILIVAIDTSADRISELTDVPHPAHGGGRAPLYARFIAEELKPFIDRTFRTLPDRDHTAVCGSSLGGYCSLYLLQARPDIFGRCAALSPSLQWAEQALLHRWETDPPPIPRARIWIDMGDAESDDPDRARSLVDLARRMADALSRAGHDVRFTVAPGAGHNESAWAERFPDVLRFLFPPDTP